MKEKVPDWPHKFNYAHKSTLLQNVIIYAMLFLNDLCQLSPERK